MLKTETGQITVILVSLLFFVIILPMKADSQNREDSPFGFHPGNANNYEYIQDLGASWSREGVYLVWDWVDVNRNGLFRFKNATAPPKPGVQNSGGPLNYDAELMNVPDNIIIMKNISPFGKGGEFAGEAEKQQFYNFVKATVERYDGDDDLGCTEPYPDCYNPGDNEYPDQNLVDRLKENPVKYWQVCNQLFDACKIDCQNTYAQKFAEVQRLTYLAAKEADSTVQVLIAGDSHMREYPDVFNELNGNYIDIIDLHRFGEENRYNPEEHLNYLKSSLTNAGFDLNASRFWITETGTYSGDPVPRTPGLGTDRPYQDEIQQASGLLKIYVSDLARGVEKVFWAWNIVEGFQRDGSIFDYCGLVYDGYEWTGVSSDDPSGVYSDNPEDILYDKGAGVKKLAYYTYKLMTQKLEGSDWENVITVFDGTNNVYGFEFTVAEKPIWILWWDWYDDPNFSEGDSASVELFVGGGDSVLITQAVPDAESGIEILQQDYPAFFLTMNRIVENDTAIITLGKKPVYVEAASSVTLVEKQKKTAHPQSSVLSTNYPNPFNSSTTIQYILPQKAHVSLSIYNNLGQLITVAAHGVKKKGKHSIRWDAHYLPTGIYYYRIETESFKETKKMLLLR